MPENACCDTMKRALGADGPSLEREDGKMMMLLVGRTKSAEGKIVDLLTQIHFCPFCGSPIEAQ